MKLKSDFVMHEVGDEYVVVPVNERTKDFHGMIRLNQSGAFLWEQMQGDFQSTDLVAALLERYEVSEEVAAESVKNFLEKLVQVGIVQA